MDRVQYFERLPAVIDLLDGIEADRRLVGKQARALLRSGVEWTAEEQSTLDGLADQAKEEASRHAYAKLTLAWIQLVRLHQSKDLGSALTFRAARPFSRSRSMADLVTSQSQACRSPGQEVLCI